MAKEQRPEQETVFERVVRELAYDMAALPAVPFGLVSTTEREIWVDSVVLRARYHGEKPVLVERGSLWLLSKLTDVNLASVNQRINNALATYQERKGA